MTLTEIRDLALKEGYPENKVNSYLATRILPDAIRVAKENGKSWQEIHDYLSKEKLPDTVYNPKVITYYIEQMQTKKMPIPSVTSPYEITPSEGITAKPPTEKIPQLLTEGETEAKSKSVMINIAANLVGSVISEAKSPANIALTPVGGEVVGAFGKMALKAASPVIKSVVAPIVKPITAAAKGLAWKGIKAVSPAGAKTAEKIAENLAEKAGFGEMITPSGLMVIRDSSSKIAETGLGTELKTVISLSKEKTKQAANVLLEQAYNQPQATIDDYLMKYIDRTPVVANVLKPGVEKIKEGLESLYTKVFNRFNPIERLPMPIDIPQEKDPRYLVRRFTGVNKIADSKLFWKTTELTSGGKVTITGKGLNEILEPAKNNLDDLSVYMRAQRDLEYKERGLRGGDVPDAYRVITALRTKHGDNFKVIDTVAQEIRDWTDRAWIQPMVKLGVITPENYEKMMIDNRKYAPIKWVEEFIEKESPEFMPGKRNIFNPQAVPIKALKGRAKEQSQKSIDPLELLIEKNYRITNFIERTRVNQSAVDLMKPLGIAKVAPTPSPLSVPKNVIKSWEDGKQLYYSVPDDIAVAMKGLDEGDMGALHKALAIPARFLRAGATLSPEFMFRNPVRDQFSAAVYSKYGFKPGYDFIKGAFSMADNPGIYWKWLASGAGQAELVNIERIPMRAKLTEVIGEKNIKQYANPLKFFELISQAGERGTRIGAFQNAIEKGASDLQAMFESRDLTIDFARRGSQTRAINSLIPFFNANLQGMDKMVRAFAEAPKDMAIKTALGITLPSFILWNLNKDNPRYTELPQWEKDLYWIIIPADESSIIRIPKPFELGILFGSVPEHIWDYARTNDKEQLLSVGKAVKEGAMPTIMPAFATPVIEDITNWSFFKDRPLVSGRLSGIMPEYQEYFYGSRTISALAKQLKVSPIKLENGIRGYTAGLGTFTMNLADIAFDVISPAPISKPAKHFFTDTPGVRGFFAREYYQGESDKMNKFYTFSNELNTLKSTYDYLRSENKTKEAVELVKKHPEMALIDAVEVARTSVNMSKKVMNLILNSPKLSPEEKRDKLDIVSKQMNDIIIKFMNELKGLEKKKK